MAARLPGVTVESVLGKISRDHLECPICSDRFTQPKLLDCLHSFCFQCLNEVKRNQPPQVPKLQCPLCRRETELDGDVSDLPSDFKLSALVDEVNIYEKLLEGQRSEIKCQACDQENQAVSRCMDCDHFLCKECQAAHGQLNLTKSHQIYTLAQLQSGDVTYKSKLREYTPKCGKHSDQNLNIYCDTCEQLVCTTCALLDHERHFRVDLHEAVDKCKRDVAKLSQEAEQNKAKLKTNIKEADDNYRKLNATHEDTIKKISTKADTEVAKIMEEVARVREEERNLKQQENQIFKKRSKKLETARATNNHRLTQTEKKLDEVNQFVTQASHYEILDLKPKLLLNLRELTKEQSEKGADHSLSSVTDFEEGTGRSLGRLVQKKATVKASQTPAKWELKREIQKVEVTNKVFGDVNGLAVFSDNIMVALVKKKLYTFSTDGNLQPHELQHVSLDKPSHISVNREDEMVVLDKDAVKIFKKDEQSCYQFQPGGNTGNKPTCLAVDVGAVIAVGYQKQEEISLHKRDGSLIRRLPAPKIGSKLAIHKQQLFYLNREDKLSSMDVCGHKVFSGDVPCNFQGKAKWIWETYSLCCDKDGNIYVALRGLYINKAEHVIQQFSNDGQYIDCVMNERGDFVHWRKGPSSMFAPKHITFTPAGELVLSTPFSVKVYHQV